MEKYKVEFIEKETDLHAFCRVIAERILNGDIELKEVYDKIKGDVHGQQELTTSKAEQK